MVTAAEVEAEHRAALASLTHQQHQALARLAMARQRVNFNHHTEAENLSEMFEREALVRSARSARATGQHG